MYSMPLNDTQTLFKYAKTVLKMQKYNEEIANSVLEDYQITMGKGSFWYGEFQVPCSDEKPLDTFLKFLADFENSRKNQIMIF